MFTILAAAAALLVDAGATAPPPLPPHGPWRVHYEDNLCLMERRFTVGDAEMILAWQPLLDLPEVEVSLIVPDKDRRQFEGRFAAEAEPAGRHFDGQYISAISASKPGVRVTRLTIERDALDQLKDGDVLRVHAKPVDLAFSIVKPASALAALAACDADLRRSWGVNLAKPAHPAVLPKDVAAYFSPNEYPHMALENGNYGRVITLLTVSAAGKVEQCHVISSSAGALLTDRTCKIALRMQFKPARDEADMAVPSSYVMPVSWKL